MCCKAARWCGGRSNGSSAGNLVRSGAEILLDTLGRALHRSASEEIELVALTQQMQPDVKDRGGALLVFLGKVGAGHIPAVHYVDGSGPEHPKLLFLFHDDGGVFVQPETQEPRVLCYSAEQPADPAALGEVLIDDDVPEIAQPGSHQQFRPYPVARLPF